ncbi:MAG TPA: cobalamin-independent methionine synthase II family protein [Burkholderiales bacterium]|nr:cobalamin-independent methionine synthase II family protein [Burkholderiales bacterium]
MSKLDTIRTDVVGSLLRPARWKEARLQFETGKMSKGDFDALELDCIREHLVLQESLGLDVVTDGEVSRLNFQDSFGLAVSGYETAAESVKSQEQRAAGGTPLARWDIPDLAGPGTPVVHRRPVKSRLALKRNVPLEEYRRVAPLARKPVKVSLIGPDRIQQRFDVENSRQVYRDYDSFLADVVAIQRQMIGELVQAGCRYVHIDEPGYTAYVDEPSLETMRKRGEDPMQNFARSLKANAEIVQGFPGVTFGIHLCRGNQRSMWHREGTYDAIAERLFNELPYQRFLLEYDSPRAGSFAPLRFVPKGKVVVLGLVSTKIPDLEPIEILKRRIDEATKYLPLEQLAISPQCGFGSDAVGNLISEDDQERKLARVVEVAREVWR